MPKPLLPYTLEASIVAGGDDHDDPAVPCRFHGLAERILGVAGRDAAAERQVDHADVVGVLESNRLLNGGDHSAVGADAVSIEGAKVDQVRSGRNACQTARPRDIRCRR